MVRNPGDVPDGELPIPDLSPDDAKASADPAKKWRRAVTTEKSPFGEWQWAPTAQGPWESE